MGCGGYINTFYVAKCMAVESNKIHGGSIRKSVSGEGRNLTYGILYIYMYGVPVPIWGF